MWIYFSKNDGKNKNVMWKGLSKVTSVNGKKLFIDQGARLATVNRGDAVRVGEEFWRVDGMSDCEDGYHVNRRKMVDNLKKVPVPSFSAQKFIILPNVIGVINI